MNKNTMGKKIIAILLTIAMVPTLVPSISWAAPASDASDKQVQSQEVEKRSEKKAESTEAKEESKEETKEETKATEAPKEEKQEETKATEAPKEDSSSSEEKKDSSEGDNADSTKDSSSESAGSGSENQVKEDAEKDEPKDEEEEIKYPAQDFEETSGGVTIRVHAPKGALPEDTDLKVASVNADDVKSKVQSVLGEDAKVITAKDLKFYYNGDKVQPKDGQDLTVTFEYDKFTALKNPNVVHVKDSGAAEKISSSASANRIKFEADEFSAYIIADIEKAEAEVSSPAQDFEGSDGGVTVKVHAPEGALPEGTEMKVSAVSIKKVASDVEDVMGEDAKVIKAMDVSFYKDSEKIEPADGKNLSVKFVSTAFKELESASVVHIKDNGNAEKIGSMTKGSQVAFKADEFSVYAVVGEEVAARLTINFYNGETLIDTIYVKSADTLNPSSDSESDLNDILYDPGIGTVGNEQVFKGWAKNEESYTVDTEARSIETIREEADAWNGSEDETWNLYAMVFNVYHIAFLDEKNVTIKGDTLIYNANETSAQYQINTDYTPADEDENFEGWNVGESSSATVTGPDDNPEPPFQYGKTVTISGDSGSSVAFTVNAPKGNWLSFQENGKGASYTPPQFIKTDDVTQKPGDPTRLGYDFGGWYENAECTGNQFVFGGTITQRTTLYAKWTAKPRANYNVIIWKQNVTGDGYDFEESIKLEGNSNTTINTVTASGQGNNRYASVDGDAKRYTGFHLDTYDTNVTIKPDGTSVVNVYYVRNEITFNFYLYGETYTPTTGNSGTQYGLVDGEYVQLYRWNNNWYYGYGERYRGTRYTRSNGWELYQSMTGLYGSSLADNGYAWPADYDWYENGGSDGTPSGSRTTFLDAFMIPGGGTSENFYGRAAASGSSVVEWYKQKADGSGYELANTVSTNAKNPTFSISDKYNGYTAHHYQVGDGQVVQLGEKDGNGYYATGVSYAGTTLKIYFNRSSYKINFYDGKYFNGDGAEIEDETSSGQLHEVDDVAYGANISEYNNYKPEDKAGYVFDGWCIDDTCTQPYTFGSMPASGLTVYAKWVKIQYRVFLHPNVPTSDTSFAFGQTNQQTSFRANYGEKLAGGTTIQANRNEYELIGWYQDEACTKPFNFDAYVMNDTNVKTPYNKTEDTELDKYGNPTESGNKDVNRAWITKKLDLYAKWRSVIEGADGIKVHYDAGEGTGAPIDNTTYYLDNAEAMAGAASTPNDTSKKFMYWVVQTWDKTQNKYVDSDRYVYPGDTFDVLKSDARCEVTEWEDAEQTKIKTATYTVQLRAEYDVKNHEKPTHIRWYANNETGEFTTDPVDEDGLKINEAINIRGADTFTYDGYEFIGWARYEEGQKPGSPIDDSKLWLKYENGEFKEGTKTVTQVAADERKPYHDLYAIWKTKVQIRITGNTDSKVYNGGEQSIEGYKVEYKVGNGAWTEDAPQGVSVTLKNGVQAVAFGTNVGNYPMGLTKDSFNIDPASYYFKPSRDLEVIDGNLEITKIPMTVKIIGHTSSVDYDGEAHTVTGYEVEIPEGADFSESDIRFTPTPVMIGGASATRTDYGKTNMNLTADLFSVESNNYDVTFEVTDGYQEIKKLDVTVVIKGKTSSVDYNGAEHTITGYTVESISSQLYTEEDFTFSGTAEAKRTDAGKTDMNLAARHFTNNNDNFHVTFDVTDGYQEIKKINATVTITGRNNTTDYDGSNHEVSGYDVTAISTPLYTENDFTFSGEAKAERTDAGQTDMGLNENQFANTNENFETVTFVITDGYQKINKISATVTITGNNNSATYDGEEHSVSGYEVSISNPLYKESDFTFSGTASAARTEEGTTNMGLEESQFTNTNTTNFENVTFKVTDGYQTIVPIDEVVVTITGHNNTTDYDGADHSVNGYEVQISNPLYKAEYFTFSGNASANQKNVGTAYMGLTAEQFVNNNKNFKKVTFNVTDGYQKIEPIDVTVTITGKNDTKDYDGAAHSVSGYDVSISNPLYTEADFSFNGTAAASRTDVGTTNMGLNKNQFKNNNNNFGTVTFNVTDGFVTIKPIDITVIIVGANNTTAYDGAEHTVKRYTATASNSLYDVTKDFSFTPAEGAVLVDGTIAAKRTDAGTTEMGLAAKQFANKNSNFGTVTFEVTDGYQTITPIDVTVNIVGANNSTAYDGEEHKVTGYTATASSTLYDVAKDFTFTPAEDAVLVDGTIAAKRTDAGTTNMGLKAEQFANTNTNFGTVTFNVTDGFQTITPITTTVTITGANNETDYDGNEHTVKGYTAKADTTLYDVTKDFTFTPAEGATIVDGKIAAKRTNVGTTQMGLEAKQFDNTNENFSEVTFEIIDGYQKINKIDVTVTITGHFNSTTYDGEEHSVNGYDVEFSNDLYTEADFTFSGTDEAKRTDVGTTNMGLAPKQFANKNENFGTVTFEVTDGYQTITAIDVTVTITGHNSTVNYDGKEHEVSGYDVAISTPLYTEADFTFNGTAEAKRTDAGTTNMGLKAEQFTNTNTNFGTVTFNVTDGYQKIDPIDVTVTITGHNQTDTYDGEEHSVSGYDFEASTPLYKEADFTFSGTAEAARTEQGTTNMGLTKEQFENTNDNFKTVTFNVTDGYQTITPIDEVVVTITGHHSTDSYNGQEHSVSGYDVQISNPLYKEADFTFSGKAEAARTNAGTTEMGLAADQFTNTNDNFAKVTFNVTDGYQTIDPIDVTVTITGHNNTSNYDGKNHQVEGYDVSFGSPLYTENDFTFSDTAFAERTNVGTTNMGLTAEQFANTNTNFGTVTFNVTDGYQKIEPIDVVVTIVGANNTTAYDGEEHSVSGYTATANTELYDVENDFSFSGTAEAKRTDAGTTNMNLASDQFTNTNGNFATVTFNVTDGYQTITPIDVVVTIVGENNTNDYDGEEHSVSGYTATANTELYDVEKDFTFSGTAEAKRTDAGTTNMGLASGQFTNTNGNFATVTFNVTDGYQTITPINVVVTIVGKNNTTNYDGAEHSVSGYTATADNDLYDVTKDFTFSGTAEAKRTDAGTTNMGLASGQFTNTNGNFATVTFNVTDGYQTINPIDVKVTIVGANNTTNYDGKEHSVSGYTATADNDLYDVTKDITFSGSAAAARTDAGKTDMGLAAEQFKNNNSNFANVTFEVTDGYQKIDPIDVTVTIVGKNNTTDYDGAAHTVTGYRATASTALYDVTKDFTFSGTASATRTDAGTTNMGLAAEQFANTNTNFKTVTFEVTDGYQKIDPIDVTVTITGHNNTANYDGTEHAVTGYDVTMSTPLYKEADFEFAGTAEAARTDAGKTNMNLDADQFKNKNNNFAKVTFEVTDGYQKIDPIDVTVTIIGQNHTDTYDGKEHSVSGYDFEASTPLYKEADFTFSGTAEAARTEQGTTNMGLTKEQFTNTNANFKTVTFNVTDGYQTITPIDEVVVTITGHHSTDSYDGEEHSVSGYDVEISNPLYKEADFTFSGTAEAARTDAGQTNMNLDADQFTNTNDNFAKVTFNVTDGYQTINPIDVTVTITGHNNTSNYDGENHQVQGYDVSFGNPLYTKDDFTFSGTAFAERTNVGTTYMELNAEQFANTNDNFRTVTFNVTDGYQKIDSIDVVVTIVGNNNTTDYDGNIHTVDGYTATASTELYDVTKDFDFTGSAIAARSIAGTTNMGLASGQFSNKNTNFRTVTFNVTDGYQTINPIDAVVTIIGNNNTTDYDGEAHTVTGYTATADTPLYDVNSSISFSGTATATRTDAGTTNMKLTADQFKNTNGNFANVTFKVTDGYQKVDPIDVTVTIVGNSNTTNYDGAEHSVSGYTATADNELYDVENDFTFSGTAEAKRIDAGTTNMGLAAAQFTNTNPNFETVTFNVTDGYQKIDPIKVTVTITGNNDEANYDGTAHTVTGYTAKADTELFDVNEDITFTGNATATRTDVGTTEMNLATDQFSTANPNFNDVTFNVTDGYQTIKPIDVTVKITGHNNTTDYDGTEHSISGYEVEISNPLYKEADFTFSGTAAAARTDAGKTDMGLKADQFENTNPNFDKVTFEVTDGYQKIDPIDVTVTITGNTSELPYDGVEHEVTGYTAKADSDLYDVTKDFTFSGTAEAKRTDAGTTKMGLAKEQFENTNPNFANVTFKVTDGYQTIKPIDVTVTIVGASNEADYDGEEHSVSGYTATASTALYDVTKDFAFSGTAEAKRTNAGTTKMGLTKEQFANTNGNFAKVIFNVTDGYQTINPIDVTVTIVGASNETDYDGEEHSVSGYTATASAALYDVTKDFTFSGTAEAARTDAGTTNMGLAKEQFANTNENFANVTFNVTDGYQTIKPINVTVTITGHHDSTTYDGTEHSVSGYDVEISNALYTEADFTFDGTAEAARTEEGTTNMGLAKEQFTNTNDNFATVTFNVTDGYQTIVPVDEVVVTITGHHNTTSYDGEEHGVSGYDVEISNPLYKEADFTFSGTAEAKRTDAGTTTMGLAEGQFTNTNKNFKTVIFNVTDGYQTIDPIDVTVTITGHNNSTDYDGEEHSVSGYDVEISNPLYKEADFTFSGTAEAKRTDAGTTNMNLAAEQFENTNENFKTVTFNVTDGYQTIKPINVTVTITGHNNTTDYDGKEHSVSSYDVEIGNPLYKEADFTFSGTAEAKRTDAGTTKMGLAKEQFTNTNGNFANVTFNVTDGYQTINPINVAVTITGHNNSTNYDGKEHSVSGYDVEISNQLYKEADFTFSGTAEAARTDAGTTNMGLAADQFRNKNGNFATVTFEVTDGYQTINPIDVTVTILGHNNTSDYDGTEHTVTGFTPSTTNALYDVTKDFTFSGNAEAKRTDAGTTNMGLAAEQFTNINSNFRAVTFEVTDGYQTINPIDVTVTITGHNNSTDYDGEEHSVSGYDVEISNPLYKEADFTFSGTAEAARTDAGTTNMGLAKEQFANTNNNFANVTFEVTDGYQTIKKINVTVTITGHHDSKTYDGTEHSVSGYDVEISNPLYTEDDFTFEGNAEAARTDEGTTNMGLAKEQFTNTNANFATVTFNVTDGYQTIVPVDEVVVTITGHHNTTSYDGEEHGVSGYDVEISNPLYKEADFTFSGTAEAKRTDAGTTNMGLAEGQFTNTNKNFKTVTFKVTDGYQTIDPIDVTVTITGHNNSTDYDGEEHSVSGYDVEISTPLYTEADFAFSGKAEAARTDAGTTNMGLAEGQFANTNENFANVTFNVTDGYQTIKPISVTVTIKGHKGTDTYDGQTHVTNGYDVEISNSLYTEDDFSFKGTATAARIGVGTAPMNLNSSDFVNDNENFQNVVFTIEEDGSQTITARKLTITTEGGTKEYDGTPLTNETVTVDGLIPADGATVTTTGTQTNVGESDNTCKIDWDDPEAAKNYEIENHLGKLKVTESTAEVTLTAASDKKTYDGTALTNAEVTAKGLPEGFTFEATASGSQTDAGSSKNVVNSEYVIRDSHNADVTEYFTNIKTKEGNLTVNKAPLTITTPDANKVYDGTALTAKGSIEGFVNGETATFVMTGSQTEVGESANNYSLTWDGTAKESNYEISKTIGTLAVTEYAEEITVTTTGGTSVYDGEAHGATVKVSTLPKGYTVKTAASTATATDVTTTPVHATADQLVIINAEDKDVTDKLNIKKVDGTIEITPATLTVKTETGTKVYDGDPLTADGTITGFMKDETADFEVTGSRTDVGTSDNTYSLVFAGEEGASDKATAQRSNYTIEESIGKLNVTESAEEIVVTTTGGTSTYDGKPHGATVVVSTLPKGYTLEKAASSATATDATDEPVKATADTLIIRNAKGEDVTSKLKIKLVDGEIVINRAPLTITTPDAEKVYDGTALTAKGNIDGFVNGETATFKTTGSQTEVGESANSYSLTWDGSAKESNYEISEIIGKLTVTEYADEITVTTTGGTSVYDGEAHGATVEVSTLPKGYTVETAASTATATDVTETAVPATADQLVIRNAEGEDVTAKLNIKKVDGTIEITPAKLTVVTENGTKVYDGEPLTAGGSIDGFVKGETAAFAVTGSQTDVGTSDNTYSIDWNNGTAEKNNYTIASESIGKLTVTEHADEIVVTTTGGTFTYDGKPHGATVEVSTLPKGYTLDTAASSATVTDATDEPVKATADTLIIRNAKGEDVTSKLKIKLVDGEIVINKAPLTITMPGAEKPYDGTPLTAAGTITGFVNGENADFETTGSQLLAGKSDNTYSLIFKGEEGASENATARRSNYEIVASVGELIVTKNQTAITVSTESKSKVYDGKELTAEEGDVTVTGLPKEFTYEVTVSGSVTNVINDEPVKSRVTSFIIRDADGNDVTDQFTNITKEEGTLSITPRTVTLVSEGASKTYDGSPLTRPNVTVGGDGFVESDNVTAEATGTITEVGSVINTITVKVTGGTNYDEANYNFVKKEGTLNVIPVSAKITIAAANATKKYDGTPLQAPKATVTGLPEGYTADVTVEGSATDVSDTESGNNEITKYVIRDAAGKDVTDQFEKAEIVTVDGTLTITPRRVILTSGTSSRTYNGAALTNDKVTVSGDGFASGEGATYNVTGTRTDAGASDNTFTYKLKTDSTRAASKASAFVVNKRGVTKESNYTIQKVVGQLTVNPKTITVTTSDAEKTYDGTALKASGKLTGLVSGETVTFRTTGARTAVGKSVNTYSLKWNGTAKQMNYAVREDLGTLTVTAAAAATPAPAGPAGTAGTPRTAVAPGPVATLPATDIVENDPPLTDLDDNDTPLSVFDGAWALLNLLCMIATAVICILLLGFYFIKKREDEDEGQEEKTKKKLIIRLLGIIPAIVAIITFFLTEDLTQPMEFVDKYTILMLLILVVEVIIALFAKKTTEEEEEDQNQTA